MIISLDENRKHWHVCLENHFQLLSKGIEIDVTSSNGKNENIDDETNNGIRFVMALYIRFEDERILMATTF